MSLGAFLINVLCCELTDSFLQTFPLDYIPKRLQVETCSFAANECRFMAHRGTALPWSAEFRRDPARPGLYATQLLPHTPHLLQCFLPDSQPSELVAPSQSDAKYYLTRDHQIMEVPVSFQLWSDAWMELVFQKSQTNELFSLPVPLEDKHKFFRNEGSLHMRFVDNQFNLPVHVPAQLENSGILEVSCRLPGYHQVFQNAFHTTQSTALPFFSYGDFFLPPEFHSAQLQHDPVFIEARYTSHSGYELARGNYICSVEQLRFMLVCRPIHDGELRDFHLLWHFPELYLFPSKQEQHTTHKSIVVPLSSALTTAAIKEPKQDPQDAQKKLLHELPELIDEQVPELMGAGVILEVPGGPPFLIRLSEHQSKKKTYVVIRFVPLLFPHQERTWWDKWGGAVWSCGTFFVDGAILISSAGTLTPVVGGMTAIAATQCALDLAKGGSDDFADYAQSSDGLWLQSTELVMSLVSFAGGIPNAKKLLDAPKKLKAFKYSHFLQFGLESGKIAKGNLLKAIERLEKAGHDLSSFRSLIDTTIKSGVIYNPMGKEFSNNLLKRGIPYLTKRLRLQLVNHAYEGAKQIKSIESIVKGAGEVIATLSGATDAKREQALQEWLKKSLRIQIYQEGLEAPPTP